jgi:hypothetical protein
VRKWLYDRPWIWVVLFLGALIGASIATVIIAEVNKPEIVKPKAGRKGATSSSVTAPERVFLA